MEEESAMRDNSKLCYISGESDYDKPGPQEFYAYFTTQALSEQWGDDWNDAPYECNAGSPYLPSKYYSRYDRENDKWVEGSDYTNEIPNWRIYIVTFTAPDYSLPNEYTIKSLYDGHSLSVDRINNFEAAWLWPSRYSYMHAIRSLMAGERLAPEPIFAGVTLKEFCSKIAETGSICLVEEYV